MKIFTFFPLQVCSDVLTNLDVVQVPPSVCAEVVDLAPVPFECNSEIGRIVGSFESAKYTSVVGGVRVCYIANLKIHFE